MSAVLDEAPSAVVVVDAASPPQIVCKPIESLRLNPRNTRTHSAAQLQQIKASLIEFGWTNPALEDADGIVAGHGRITAAKQLYEEFGITIAFPNGAEIPFGHVPTLWCEGWSEEKRRAYAVVDNQLALNAGWDDALLSEEVKALLAAEFDVGLLGFPDNTLTVLSGGWVEPPSHPINDIERNTLLIEFQSESELQAAFTELQARGWAVKIMS